MDPFPKEFLRTGIPTENPWEALQFCRTLASLLHSDARGRLSHQPLHVGLPESEGIAQEAVAAASVREAVNEAPDVSVVLPIFNEQENVPALYQRLSDVLGGQGLDYELIFVDDGSRDQSLALLENLASRDARVKVVQLARNFGHQVAISAGLDYARGQGVIVMDADLQDPPEVLPQFIAKWREGYDVVYAIREERQENWLKRLAYASFYRLLRRIARVDIPLDAGDFSIMDRRVVDLLRAMPERSRFVRGIRSWVGLRQCGLSYPRQARQAGQPKYSFSRLLLLAMDGFISFSQAPLRLASLLGLGMSLASFFMVCLYLVLKIIHGHTSPSSGFTTLVVAIFFLGGIQLITIGVMGEYIGRIFDEVKQRPLYVVRRVWGF